MSFWRRLVYGELRESSLPAWKLVAGSSYHQTIMEWRATDDHHAKQGRSTGRVVLGGGRQPETRIAPRDARFVMPPLSASEGMAAPSSQRGEGGRAVYLKRHYRMSWRQRLLAALWPSRGWSPASAEWNHLRWAQYQGIAVPEPLAVGEFIGPWFQLQSYLVIRELTGMLPLHQAIPAAWGRMAPDQFRQWKRMVIREMARITRVLHRQDRFHKDLYLCHFYVEAPSPPYRERGGSRPQPHDPEEVYLIDLHRLGHHAWFSLRWRVKDLAQLLYSTWGVAGIEDRDRWAFLRAYFLEKKWTQQRRLLRFILRKAARYARHNHLVAPWLGQPPRPSPHQAGQRGGKAA